MKAEERHELKENDLQSWLQYGLPIWFKQNWSYLLLVAALCVLAYQLWDRHERTVQAKASAGWSELLATEDAGVEGKATKLQGIIDEYDSKPVRAIALRDLGMTYVNELAAGHSDDLKDTGPLDRQDTLKRAQAAFERVINEFPDQLLAVGDSRLGLAAVAEDSGDWDAARKQYEILTAKSGPFAGTAFAAQAAERLATLDQRKNAPKLAELPVPPPATRPGGLSIGPDGKVHLPETTVMPAPAGTVGPELPATTGPGK